MNLFFVCSLNAAPSFDETVEWLEFALNKIKMPSALRYGDGTMHSSDHKEHDYTDIF